MSNVQDLMDFIGKKPIGTELDIATSKYADNTNAPGHVFDFWSTAPAVRSLIKAGYLIGECGWRYYRVTVLRPPSNAMVRAEERAVDARAK